MTNEERNLHNFLQKLCNKYHTNTTNVIKHMLRLLLYWFSYYSRLGLLGAKFGLSELLVVRMKFFFLVILKNLLFLFCFFFHSKKKKKLFLMIFNLKPFTIFF